ncbi:DVUA0089 family protein [Gudongella sp. SC589]|uniref:DVUA0089 family protein n=1 Tax=Gudongella sp. SC589 TaxID=3385990 RepID=UPI0039049F19
MEGIRIEVGETLSGSLEESGDRKLYNFVVATEDTYVMFTTSNFDPMLYLYDVNMVQIQSNDDSGGNLQPLIIRNLAIGNYYLEVAGWGLSYGDYQLTLDYED